MRLLPYRPWRPADPSFLRFAETRWLGVASASAVLIAVLVSRNRIFLDAVAAFAVCTSVYVAMVAMQRRRQADRLFRSMFEADVIGICVLGTDGAITDANAKFLELHQLEPADLPSVRWTELGAPSSRAADAAALAELRREGRFKPYERESLGRHGRPTTLLTAASLFDPRGAAACFSVDLTAQSVARCALEGAQRVLAARVAELQGERSDAETVAERARVNLETHRGRVEELAAHLAAANAELETFSYSVSHDLRTPLRAIDGFAHELELEYGPRLDDRGRHFLARILRGTRRMSALIDDLLSLSRLARNAMRREALDVTALARNVASEVAERYPAARFEIEEGVSANADAGLLRLALFNLLSNAAKFSSKREDPRIELGSAATPRGRALFVRDNGSGFDPAYASKLFAPFQRLHSASEFDGNGIGLAIVQRAVHRHGGAVWAESQPGSGATFYFTLPEEETA